MVDESWLEDWWSDVTGRTSRTAELARRISELRVTEPGARGAIEVTVAGAGQVTDLQLSQRAYDLRPAALAEEILATMRRAQSRLVARVADIAAETVGTDSETGRAAVASFAQRYPDEAGRDDRGRG